MQSISPAVWLVAWLPLARLWQQTKAHHLLHPAESQSHWTRPTVLRMLGALPDCLLSACCSRWPHRMSHAAPAWPAVNATRENNTERARIMPPSARQAALDDNTFFRNYFWLPSHAPHRSLLKGFSGCCLDTPAMATAPKHKAKGVRMANEDEAVQVRAPCCSPEPNTVIVSMTHRR